MASSQKSYDTRIGKFQDMIGILQTLSEYQPTNVLITNKSLKEFLSEILNKNTEVITQNTSLKIKREERRTLSFKDGNLNPECVQGCLDNITNYVAGEFGTTNSAYKQIYTLKKKIKPTYAKKIAETTTEIPKTTRSGSEKSFTGLVGLSKQVIQIITSLGSAYAPQNTAIQIANFSQKIEKLDDINQSIALNLQQYTDVVQKRKELYDGMNSMKQRTVMIRNYMASFSGGKSNPQYIQVMNALKVS